MVRFGIHFVLLPFFYCGKSGFPGGAVVKNLPANAGDARCEGSISELGRPPGEGDGNLLQDSCLGNPGQRSLEGWSTWLDTAEHGHKHIVVKYI